MRNQPQKGLLGRLATLALMALGTGPLSAQVHPLDPPRVWATSIGGSNFDFVTDAVADDAGGLYITGYTNSPNFPQTLPGAPGSGYDVFVARIDSNGGTVWSTRFGGAGGDYANAIARDASGNLLVAGRLGGDGAFITDSTYKGTGDDILVLKLTAAGTLLQALRYGGTGTDEAFGIAASPSGDIVVVGSSSGTTLPTTSALYAGSAGDAFLLRLSPSGMREWAFRYGGSSFEKAQDVVVAPNGAIYVTGETGSFDFQQTISTYQGSGGAKAFIMRFDSTGARDWAQRYGGSLVERGYALGFALSGNVLMAGYTSSANFPATIPGLGGAGLDAFLVEFLPDGTRSFARRIGGSLDDLALDLATDATGNIFMLGETQSANFPATNANFKGLARDQFLAKFGPDGSYNWSMVVGGNQNDFSGGALSAAAQAVYLAGHTQSLNYPQTLPGTGGNTARGALVRFRDCLGQRADFSAANVCFPDTVSFTNLSQRGSSDTLAYMWWFGDGDSSDLWQPTHVYAVAGAYDVTLRVSSPCGVDSVVTKRVNVYPEPHAQIAHALACEGRLTAFTDSTQLDTVAGAYLDTYAWTFGALYTDSVANPVVHFDSAAAWPVTLTVTTNHGCTDTQTDTVQVHFTPLADFSLQDVCLRDSSFFHDLSTLGGDTLSHWDWDFGDGGSSSSQNPAHLYLASDTTVVQLIVETNQGCRDTAWHFLKVFPLPVVDFATTEVCWPAPVAFTDSSTIAGDSIVGYAWEFGDNSTATARDTLHSYAASGSYDVVHRVFSAAGCSDSLLAPLKVHDRPRSAFGFENVCFPNATLFADSSTVQADSLVAWNWQFGDSTWDTLPSPSHTYALPDSYMVTLSVYSGFGCGDTASATVILLPKPQASFGVADVCVPLPTSFQSTASVLGDSLAQHLWTFGDGGADSGVQVLHAYAAGSYEATLVAITASGCRDTIADSLTVFPQPLAAFGVENTCDQDTVFFSDSSSVSSGFVAGHWYDFGDAAFSTDPNPAHVYAGPGSFLVRHIVQTGLNCFDTVAQAVVIYALPDPQPVVLGVADICIGDTITLIEQQAFASYEWETGDTTDHIRVAGRSDWVTLTVRDTNACENTDSVEVRFYNVPRPNAVVNPGPTVNACANDSLLLTAGNSYATYTWSNGVTTPGNLVSVSGTYTVIVTNGFGCVDTSGPVQVNILPAPAPPAITQAGGLLSVPTGYAAYQWYWNGLALPLANGASHEAQGTGTYFVEVQDANGCKALSDTVTATVSVPEEWLGQVLLYPNPVQRQLSLSLDLVRGGNMGLRLLDLNGRVMLRQSRMVSAGAQLLLLDLPELAAGMYLLELDLGGRRQVFRVERGG